MRSQQMYHLLQSAKEIRVAIETDGDRIGELLNEQHPVPAGEGEPAFDYRKHLLQMKAQLDLAADQAVESEDQHNHSLIRVSRRKDERDESVRTNHKNLVAIREGLESLFESGGFELAHISGKTPRVPDKLIEQMTQTASLLRDPAVELREFKITGFDVDLEAVASDLESRIPGLREAIDRLAGARKKSQGTLSVKGAALSALHRTVIWVGRTTEGLFYLAEEDELAKRIRSTTRRPARPSEEKKAEGEASAEEATSSNSSARSTSEPQTPATPNER